MTTTPKCLRSLFILFLNLSSLFLAFSCPTCPKPPPKPHHPPPPKRPIVKPCPPPPPPPSPPPPPPPSPPPPPPPKSSGTPCPPPPPKGKPETCPRDTVKLGLCVDVLEGLVHAGVGNKVATDACCPVLEGLAGLDAALCLCTTIRAKLLNVNLIVPIALQVLVGCGKTPPPGFQCPS